jgi:hypothetical protein
MTVAIRCRTYPQLVDTLNARRRQLQMTMLDLDTRSGVQDGYSAKVFCRMKNLGKLSLPLLLEGLDVELLVVLPPAAPVEKAGSASSADRVERRALPSLNEGSAT